MANRGPAIHNQGVQAEAFFDYYEILQISPNADQETIQRVYRMLAQRFHPDNQETGNEEIFRQLTAAHTVLTDPERRAAYDVHHREARRLTWRIFDQSHAVQGVDSERRKRSGVLSMLYRKRLMAPDQPYVNLREFEDLMGVPKEHLEFSLWYLKEGGYVQRGDNGRYTITLKGVDLAEEMSESRSEPLRLPAAPTRVA